MRPTKYTVYTDGASRKDGRGGWGWYLRTDDDFEHEMCGGEYDTTNNRMELYAALHALQEIAEIFEPGDRIELWSDSQYLVKGITEYVEEWTFRRWRTSSNKPIANVDLWMGLQRLNQVLVVDWRWVKGHTGDPGNEKADALAAQGVPAAPTQAADARSNRVYLRRRSA